MIKLFFKYFTSFGFVLNYLEGEKTLGVVVSFASKKKGLPPQLNLLESFRQ